jgi:hypothetical protein
MALLRHLVHQSARLVIADRQIGQLQPTPAGLTLG